MSFFYTENLTAHALYSDVQPWEFQPSYEISEIIRKDKKARQAFYQNPATKWHFYTPVEPANQNLRPSRENPPAFLHGFAADFDVPIPRVRVLEVVKATELKPAWIEESLGGKVRLVYTFESPLPVGDFDFCVYVLTEAVRWLGLGLLPGLDEAVFKRPGVLLANGGKWKTTGHGCLPQSKLQAFFVECGKDFRFQSPDGTDIPLDIIEAEIRRQYPAFTWPTDFVLESQGPSFWIPGSTSPLSAIVKSYGMFSFAAHASKPFYTWADILGGKFLQELSEDSMAKATQDIWYDGKDYYRKINGTYAPMGLPELTLHFKVNCRLSAKPTKAGHSPIDAAVSHIHEHNRITAAVPFVFRPTGLTVFQGERKLNTYINRPVSPAGETQKWGAQGNFPWLSEFFKSFFDPPLQLFHFLAWFRYYYQSAINQSPKPGQNIFLMGASGIGKSLLNRQIIGIAVGGFADASDHLVNAEHWNVHLLNVPHWCLDDDTPSNSPQAQLKTHAMFKKLVANQQFQCHRKFGTSGMTEWMGRIGCTTNLDYVSSRIIGPMDNSSLDKTNLYRCAEKQQLTFPEREELLIIISRELPSFLRWLLDHQSPDFIISDPRFGYKSFQEDTLLTYAHQSNPATAFKEILIESLDLYFRQNLERTEWRGTGSQLLKMLMTNALNDYVLRTVKLEQFNRYLEQIQREGLLKCYTEPGPVKTRIWVFTKMELLA